MNHIISDACEESVDTGKKVNVEDVKRRLTSKTPVKSDRDRSRTPAKSVTKASAKKSAKK